MKKLILNPDENHVRKIINGIINNENHCPCHLVRDKKSQCAFDEYYLPEQITINQLCENGIDNGECICKLYIKEENYE